MKKSFLTILVLFMLTSLQAQPAVLYLKDGRKVVFNVQTITGNILHGGKKKADINKLDSILFLTKDDSHLELYGDLEQNGVKTIFRKEESVSSPPDTNHRTTPKKEF